MMVNQSILLSKLLGIGIFCYIRYILLFTLLLDITT